MAACPKKEMEVRRIRSKSMMNIVYERTRFSSWHIWLLTRKGNLRIEIVVDSARKFLNIVAITGEEVQGLMSDASRPSRKDEE